MEANAEIKPPRVHNGTYTFTSPRTRHVTLKLSTVRENADPGMVGKRIVSLLMGPNNETDYVGVAFWDDDRGRAVIWKKHRSAHTSTGMVDGHNFSATWSEVQRKVAVWADLVLRGENGHWHSWGFSMQLAGTCLKCNRTLTTPESIERGIGPECWKRMGGAA